MSVLRKIRHPAGWVIMPVHYSADPEKGEEWVAGERAKFLGSDVDWSREYEIDFSSAAGALAYPVFNREIHSVPGLFDEYRPDLPLVVACDFNYHAMGWVVGQVVRGEPRVLAEILLVPGTVADAAREVRNLFPTHQAEAWIYGDASGLAKNKQSLRSDYDVLRSELRGWSAGVVMKVPVKNPPVRHRLNAVNRMLSGNQGAPRIQIDSGCKELTRDLEEVVMNPRGQTELQFNDPLDPRHVRTHLASALGYWLSREWPTVYERENVKKERIARTQPLKIQGMVKV